jgi:hypothetical protein
MESLAEVDRLAHSAQIEEARLLRPILWMVVVFAPLILIGGLAIGIWLGTL